MFFSYSEYSEYSEKAQNQKKSIEIKSIKTYKTMSNTQEMAPKRQYNPKNAEIRLQAYFKPGSKLSSYKYNADWLWNYYRTMAGPQNLGTPLDAVYRKVEEIYSRSSRLIIYDNRPGSTYPVMLEIVNGRLVTDNRPLKEKQRRPLKLY